MSSRLAGSDGSRPASRAARNHDHDASAMEHLLKAPVVVKPHPPTLSVKPRSLQPLMLLPRRHLLLSFLDLAAPSGTFEFSRFYDAQVKVLDLEARIGAEPKILVASLDYDKTIYALERQETGLYTLCKLSAGVDLGSLSQDASIISSAALRKRASATVNQQEPPPLATAASHHENKKRRLAIEAIQSLVKKPARPSLEGVLPLEGESHAPVEAGTPTGSQPTLEEVLVPVNAGLGPGNLQESTPSTQEPAVEETSAPLGAEAILDGIRTQYQEALYHSRGSLAYFAKGPLSRVRAAFHLDCDAKLDLVDLVEYLKTLVMTTVQIDKKYREIVPDIMSKCTTVAHDSDEEKSALKSRKRKAKKMKLNKDGIYPDDDDHIRKWWAARSPKPSYDDTSAASAPQKARWEISYLRSRETQLQMIIILEILSLQPLCTSETGPDSQQPSLPGDEGGVEDAFQTVKKKRNRHNLPFLLDVHADRLTIWHSTALDDLNIANSTDNEKNPEGQDGLTPTTDPLKDFCVDIIVPFFSARLPEQCETINRKLGGPVMIPPQKPRTKTTKRPDASAIKAKAKPDTTMKRVGSGSKSSLENVLSKESLHHRRSMSRGPGGMIALMRSVSTPIIPAMKREASEPASAAISKIPMADEDEDAHSPELPLTLGVKRSLGADRAKKDAQVKAELKNAITALRRPNRDVVGQAMVEDAQRRATTTLSQLKSKISETANAPSNAQCDQGYAGHITFQGCYWTGCYEPTQVRHHLGRSRRQLCPVLRFNGAIIGAEEATTLFRFGGT
ncbi:DNA replication regulator SLD3-domain-containing protein [Microdochium bolleyi]|uniref:DNA replication regulator SLD3-domain-containing protein n=1 Tax=Microdochium bolleyi TaxID=196109 RepID=A0A136J487_9PEZI|nr:DNA replication regulator SLD3-domain-containing protein [Microdochium bolleyi]